MFKILPAIEQKIRFTSAKLQAFPITNKNLYSGNI